MRSRSFLNCALSFTLDIALRNSSDGTRSTLLSMNAFEAYGTW